MNADFLLELLTTPPAKSDAIVCLCGEDAMPRYRTAFHAFRMGLAPLIVLSGGRHNPPRYIGAEGCSAALLGSPYGLSPDRIICETESQNTRQQAVNLIDLAQMSGWSKLLIVASAFHLPRALLTLIQAIREAKGAERIRVVPVPAYGTPANEAPDGMTSTRRELLAIESRKIVEYQSMGHVASYADGIDYLRKHQPVPVS